MEYREDLKAYIDGELPAAKSESIRKAAESDPALRREIEELQAVAGALQAMKKEPEVYGLEETLMALSGQRAPVQFQQGRRRPWFGFAVGLGLAAAAALVFAIPQFLSRRETAATARLASMPFAKQDTASGIQSRPLTRGRAGAARAGTQVPIAAAKPEPTLQDEVKQQQQQIQDLEKQVTALKKGPVAAPMERLSGPALPPPAAIEGTILPGGFPDTSSSVTLHAKGLTPKRITELETQVRKLAADAGGKVEASGPPIMRSVVVTIDTAKASALSAKIRGALKDGGTVSVEDILRPEDDARTQAAQDRIVDLKLQREKLLQDFLPEAPQVKELDTQIKTLQDSIKPSNEPLKSRIHIAIG